MSRLPAHDLDDGGVRGGDVAEEPPVDLGERRSTVRRRSSMSGAASALAEPSVVASTTKAPVLVAGDQLARPLFLKDRSVTMRADAGLSTATHGPTAPGHQSKASAFLVKIVEKSRSVSSVYDGKPTGNQQNGGGTTSSAGVRPPSEESDTGQAPQRRRQSIVIRESHVNKLSQIQHQNTMPALLGPARPPIKNIRSGMTHLTTHDEDEPDEYITEAELQDRSLSQLVRDLNLYKRRSVTLLRILCEIQRRLHDAEIKSSFGRPSHVALSRELVDEGVLSAVVIVLREFRFHVALQTAAVSLLSFLADVSDLYAYRMAELDVEPLVQKIVAVHVSQERLVTNGSSLIHTISERKHMSHVAKMHKARELEREKKRAASFVEAFAAERKQSKLRELGGSRGRERAVLMRDDHQKHLTLSGPLLQHSALSKRVGVPPVLTAHYDLEVSLSKQRFTVISPIERTKSGGTKETQHLDDPSPWIRPKTSPDPRHLMERSSAAKLAAVYLNSPTFVAPSPLGKRIKGTRKTHSAVSSGHTFSHDQRSGGALDGRPKTGGSYHAYTIVDEAMPSVVDRVDETNPETSHAKCETSCQGLLLKCDTQGTEGNDDKLVDEDDTYDGEEFVIEEEEHEIAETDTTTENLDRLLPVGSDSDLFELVGRSDVDTVDFPDHLQLKPHDHAQPDGGHSPSSPVIVDLGAGREDLTLLSVTTSEDATTSELVGLLSKCVNSGDQISSDKSTMVTSSSRMPRSKIPKSALPLVFSSVSVVRPVNRRILEKKAKTSAHQRSTPLHYSNSIVPAVCEVMESNSLLATAQITSVLDAIHLPVKDGPPTETETCGTGVDLARSIPQTATPTTSVAQIQALYARGLQHHKANEFEAAIRCYERGIHLQHSSGVHREFASLYINLGSARMAQERFYDALVAFTQAERIQPQNVKAVFNSGLVLMLLAQWDEAIAKFEKLLAVDPCHVRAQCALEQCHNKVGQVRKTE